jgi:hypothetical protein
MKFLKSIFVVFLVFKSSIYYSQNKDFSFVAFADLPYYLPKDYEYFNQLIDSINTKNQSFNVFLGDIKSSYTPCEDSIYSKFFKILNRLNSPVFYTPGDNEWTDCNANGFQYNPIERLNFLRKNYIKPVILKNCIIDNQNDNTIYKIYNENKSWNFNSIRFSLFHIVGSNNNYNDKYAIDDTVNNEFKMRNQANLYWLNNTFSKAKNENAKAIVLFMHADMFTPDKGKSGFDEFLNHLAKLTEEFSKPVLLINGDSHKYLIDKPLLSINSPKRTLTNFTRLQMYGEIDPYACIIKVNLNNKNIFEFNEIIILLK